MSFTAETAFEARTTNNALDSARICILNRFPVSGMVTPI